MLVLEEFERHDCDRLIQWVPDARFLLLWAGPQYSYPLDKAQLEQTIQQTQGLKPAHFMFKVLDSDNNRIIGHIELMTVDYDTKKGHIGRVLIGDQNLRGKGYGAEMMSLLIQFAFDNLGLEELTLNVFDFNKSAISCYRRLGFEHYEVRDEDVQCEGEIWTVIRMRLNRSEWKKG